MGTRNSASYEGRRVMELVLRYLENAVRFRNLAVAESNPKLKAELEKQAETYHRLAVERG